MGRYAFTIFLSVFLLFAVRPLMGKYILAVNIGVPFALLSSTGLLLPHWFSRSFPERSSYRLYALSNAGSLLVAEAVRVVVTEWSNGELLPILWTDEYASLWRAVAANKVPCRVYRSSIQARR